MSTLSYEYFSTGLIFFVVEKNILNMSLHSFSIHINYFNWMIFFHFNFTLSKSTILLEPKKYLIDFVLYMEKSLYLGWTKNFQQNLSCVYAQECLSYVFQYPWLPNIYINRGHYWRRNWTNRLRHFGDKCRYQGMPWDFLYCINAT